MDLSTFERLPAQVHEDICCWLMNGDDEPSDMVEWLRMAQDPSIDKFAGVRALSVLARTCRASHEPAIKVLWRRIPDVALLFHTLPIGCYETDEHVEIQRKITVKLTRQLEPADLTRFRLYAASVTTLGVWARGDGDDCDLLPSIAFAYVTTRKSLQELDRVAAAHGWALFPNIHTLACTDTLLPLCTSPRHLHLFGPQLREFQFERHNSTYSTSDYPRERVAGEEDIVKMLEALRPHAPQLQKLSLDMDEISPPIAQAFWSVVLSCQNVVSLNYRDPKNFPIIPAALRHLACLPFLEELAFSSKDDAFTLEEIQAFDRLLRSKTFPRLRSTEMEVKDLSLATVFVRHISSPFLQGLDVNIMDGVTVPYKAVPPFFRALRKLPRSTESVHVLFDVHCDETVTATDGPPPITHAMLRPLLACSHMSFFELRVGWPFRLNDAFLEDMVRAWPYMRVLRLGEFYPQYLEYTPEVTWNAIIAMARGWPRLKELSLCFDTDISRVPPSRLRELRESNRADPEGKALHDMDYMNVGLTKIDDEMAAATILCELFSPLEEAYSCWEDQAQEEDDDEQLRMEEEGDAAMPDPDVGARVARCLTYADRWSSMYKLMEQINLVRRQEQNWRSNHMVSTRQSVSMDTS